MDFLRQLNRPWSISFPLTRRRLSRTIEYFSIAVENFAQSYGPTLGRIPVLNAKTGGRKETILSRIDSHRLPDLTLIRCACDLLCLLLRTNQSRQPNCDQHYD